MLLRKFFYILLFVTLKGHEKMAVRTKQKVVFIIFIIFGCRLYAGDKRFVVLTPSYNNSEYYMKNLDSIMSQDYENFRVIYIDDASTDGTGALVDTYIEEHGLHEKVEVIHNQERVGGLANLYHAIHSCDDEEVIVEVDGDDALAHNHVLSFLNKVYADEKVWLTYGQYNNEPVEVAKQLEWGVKGYAKPVSRRMIKTKSFRKVWWFMALRTFYAGLFKKIEKEDLLVDESIPCLTGKFFPESWDAAMMYPMLEMAPHHFKFIDKVLYLRNVANPLNAFKLNSVLQQQLSKIIRSKECYPTLEKLF